MLSRAVERNHTTAVVCTRMVAGGILMALPVAMRAVEGPPPSAQATAAHTAEKSPVRQADAEAPSSGTRARRTAAGVAAVRTSSGDLVADDETASLSSSPATLSSPLRGNALSDNTGMQCLTETREDSFDSFGSMKSVARGSGGVAAGAHLTPSKASFRTAQPAVTNAARTSPVAGGIGAVPVDSDSVSPGVDVLRTPPSTRKAPPRTLDTVASPPANMEDVARAAVESMGLDSDDSDDSGAPLGGGHATPPLAADGTPLSPSHRRKQTLMMSMSPPIKIAAKDISALLGKLEGDADLQEEQWQGGASETPPPASTPGPPSPEAAPLQSADTDQLLHGLTPKQASARANILNEILASERSYICSLQGLVGVFVEPLASEPQPSMQYLHRSSVSGRMLLEGASAAGSASASRNLLGGGDSSSGGGERENSQQRAARSLLSHMEHAQLFGGVDTLVPLHQHLLAQLKRAVAAATNTPGTDGLASPGAGTPAAVTAAMSGAVCFGDIFMKLSNFFKMYSSYVANHAGANELLVHLQDSSKGFKEWIQTAQQQPGARGQPLQSLLIMPVQRVPRYELLLTSLLKLTPPQLPDHTDLQQALQRVKTAARAINTNITLFLTQRAVLQIQRCLIPEPEPSLVTPSRRFVREGALKKLTKGSMRPYTVFLFTDKLVYGSSATGITGTLTSLFNRGRRSSVGTPNNKRTGAQTPASRQRAARSVARQLPLGTSGEEAPPPATAPARQLRTFSSEASTVGTTASSDGVGEDTPPTTLPHAHSAGEIDVGTKLSQGAAAAGASPPPFTASAANSESALTALTAAVTTDSDKPREKVSLHCIIDFEAVESVPDSDKVQHAFVVRGSPKDVTLVAADEQSKMQWMASIRSCLYEMHLAEGGGV